MDARTKKFIINVTKEIGKIHLNNFSATKKVKFKAKSKYLSDIITKVDKISEDLFIKKTKKFGFKGTITTEESGEVGLGNSNQRLIIDPLDGTFFYSRGIPNFCVAIALEDNNKIICSTVYNAATNELFFAERGAAYLNGKRIKVSNTRNINKSTIIFSAYPKYKLKKVGSIFSNLMSFGGLRFLQHLGNLNLCYIADARYDAMIAFYRILSEWDKIPGIFILEQAGGKVTDFNGNKWNINSNNIVSSNNKFHDKIIELLS